MILSLVDFYESWQRLRSIEKIQDGGGTKYLSHDGRWKETHAGSRSSVLVPEKGDGGLCQLNPNAKQ